MSSTELSVGLIAALVALVFYFLKKKFSYFEERDIPHLKPKWILGNLSGVGSSMHMIDLVRKIYDEFKGKDVIAGMFTLASPSLIVTDIELAKLITVKDFDHFSERGFLVNEENEPLTGNLASIGGEKWRFLRTKLSPALTSGKIKMMFNTIAEKGDAFIQAVETASKKGSIEMKTMSNRYTIDVISSAAFGMEFKTLEDEKAEIIRLSKQLFGEDGDGMLLFFLVFTFPKFAKFFNLRAFPKPPSEYIIEVITSTINYREDKNIERNDFLNMLIQLKNKGSIEGEFTTEKRKLTLNECIAQAFIFFFGGSDTTSSVIAYAMVELGMNQEIQEKVRVEILEKTKSDEGKLTYDNLNEMIYLSQVVNETLRKFPPGFAIFRQATKDYKIPNSKHVIPKGRQLMIPVISFHYDEAYWKNPDDFNPDRFTAEETAKGPSGVFLPFGDGPRNCIGMR